MTYDEALTTVKGEGLKPPPRNYPLTPTVPNKEPILPTSTPPAISYSTHPDYTWCGETNGWAIKDGTVSIKGIGVRLLHKGKWAVNFAQFNDGGFTKVRCYKSGTKTYLNTYLFKEGTTVEEIRKALFDKTDHESFLHYTQDKRDSLYRAIYRYAVFSLEDWEDRYKPNKILTRYKSSDIALLSLSTLIEEGDGEEVCARWPQRALEAAQAAVKKNRADLALTNSFPCVELYGIWTNLDAESGYINLGDYDKAEPEFYSFKVFETREDCLAYDN